MISTQSGHTIDIQILPSISALEPQRAVLNITGPHGVVSIPLTGDEEQQLVTESVQAWGELQALQKKLDTRN
ncbi:hypothetical protein ACFRAQ_36065 [Nocardia sp. NPDC056611]|uniref:hypothetical protein n=1 Tax=Nocardia sp. NPDC056611 TaxID=3345877 RepID=UPI00366BB208